MKTLSHVPLISLVVLLSLFPSSTTGQSETAATEFDSEALTAFVEAQMRVSNIPGAAISVTRGDRILFAKGFGGPADSPITADSPFFIGSITKTFTALAVAQLADRGRLDFDAPVRRYLPDFQLKNPEAARTITIRHLLTHTSGLSQWSGHDRRTQQARFDHIAPVRPPGQTFEYSSLNYIILGQVIEAVSGQSYATYLRDHIFEPLEMHVSSAHPEAATRSDLVQGHWYLFGWPISDAEPSPPPPLIPAGFVISSANDMARYLSIYLNEGCYEDHRLVTSSTLQTMLTPWGGNRYGGAMAWAIDRKFGTRSANHAGNTRTFSARVRLFPEQDLGIVVLTNVNSGPFYPGSAALMDGVVRLVNGQSATPGWPAELIVKWIILGLVLFGIAQFVRHGWQWYRRGFPTTIAFTLKIIGRLAFDLGLAIGLFVGIPWWAGVPLHTMLAYFPDLGYALVIGLGTGALEGVIRAFLRSAEQQTSKRETRVPSLTAAASG